MDLKSAAGTAMQAAGEQSGAQRGHQNPGMAHARDHPPCCPASCGSRPGCWPSQREMPTEQEPEPGNEAKVAVKGKEKGDGRGSPGGSRYKECSALHFMKGSPARFRDVLLARSAPRQARASNSQLPNNCLLVSILPDRECYLGLKLI